jgi:hypothetical protein
MPRAAPTLAAVGQLADAMVVETVAMGAAVAEVAAVAAVAVPDFGVGAGDAVAPLEPQAPAIMPRASAATANQRGLLWNTGSSFQECASPICRTDSEGSGTSAA